MRWRAVGWSAGLVAVGLTPVWGPLALRPFAFFAVRRVELVGVRYLDPEVVVGSMGLRDAASVWDRLGPVAERVRGLPGVEEAVVRRRLPGTIRVVVREAEPVAVAAGADGLVPLAADGRPLPYDPAEAGVDVPVVARADRELAAALDVVRRADPALYAGTASASRVGDAEVRLDIEGRGRVRLAAPVDPEVVRAVAAVQRDLESRSQAWRELDGRFRGWVVVRRPTEAEASS